MYMLCIYIYICICTYTHIRMCTYRCVHRYVHTHTHTHICIYIYMYNGHLSSVGRSGISGSMLQFVARVAFDFIFNIYPIGFSGEIVWSSVFWSREIWQFSFWSFEFEEFLRSSVFWSEEIWQFSIWSCEFEVDQPHVSQWHGPDLGAILAQDLISDLIWELWAWVVNPSTGSFSHAELSWRSWLQRWMGLQRWAVVQIRQQCPQSLRGQDAKVPGADLRSLQVPWRHIDRGYWQPRWSDGVAFSGLVGIRDHG